MMFDFDFAYKYILWLLLLIPVIVTWYAFRTKQSNTHIKYSSTKNLITDKISWKIYGRHLPFALKMLGISLLIIVLARPQSSLSWQDVSTEGIDIIMALDISGSMLAEDLKPNRLEASKAVAINFINERPNDRIGLVVYSGESFTQCPLTTDHAVLKNLFEGIKNGIIEDGTAIGLGLANSINRLKDSDAKSKVVILLTDGENNSGSIPPITAAEIAKSFGVRVYTIGVGSIGTAPYPFQNPFGGIQYQDIEVKIDEKVLTKIADMTGGKYFRATNNKSLSAIYDEIDKMEKSKINVTEYRKKSEKFLPFALLAILIFGIEFLLNKTIFKSITV